MQSRKHRWLLDINFLIDLAANTRAHHEPACEVVRAAAGCGVELCVSVAGLKDVYYILQKNYTDERSAQAAVARIMEMFSVVNLTEEMAQTALASDEPDFEDGIVRVTAQSCACSHIVSRDVRAFENSAAKRLDPEEACRLISENAL